MYRITILVLITLFKITNTNSQTLKFHTFPNHNEINYLKVNSIFEDKSGFVWLGTDQGCLRNDGEQFKSVSEIDSINSFYETRNGNVLAGSTSGILIFNKWGITTLKTIDGIKDLYIAGTAGYNKFWCLSSDKIFCLDENLNIVARLQLTEKLNTQMNFSSAISKLALSDTSGRLFLYNQGQLRSFLNLNGKVTSKVVLYGDSILLSRNLNGEVWMFNRSSSKGAWFQNLYNGNIILAPRQVNINSQTTAFTIFSTGIIYLCTQNSGLVQYEPTNKRVYIFRNNIYDKESLSDNEVQCCFEDQNNRLWVATSAGIGLSQSINTQFKYYLFNNHIDRNPIERPTYTDIEWLNDSTCILFTTGQTPIIKLKIREGTASYISLSGYELPSRIVKSVHLVKHKWLVSAMNGNFIYDDYTDQIIPAADVKMLPEIFSLPSIIKASFHDHAGNIYLSIYNHSLVYKFISIENRWLILSSDSALNRNYFPLHSFIGGASDKGSFQFEYFISETGTSIARLNYYNGNFSNFPVKIQKSNQRFLDITTDERGILWLATEKGVFKANLQNGNYHADEISIISRLLGDQNIRRIFCADSNLWITTTEGIIKYNTAFKSAEIYDSEDGLIDEEFGLATSIHPVSGDVISTTTNGVLIFHPKLIKKRKFPLVPVFTNCKVNGKIRNPESDHFSLSYNERNIRIEFATPRYRAHQPVVYSYKLVGYHDTWSAPSSFKYVEFHQLPAGKYSLIIRASTDGIDWTETNCLFTFKVKKPFYLQPLFFILCILLITAGLFLHLHQKQKARLKQFMMAQEIRNNISRDLHDDLGSALSSISFISDIGQKSGLEKARKYHQLIGDTSRTMIDAINDIVWVVNPKNDSMESLIYRMRRFSSTLFEARNIRLHFKDDETLIQLQLPMNMRRNLYMIFKEIVNNAAKHSGATEVTIDLIRNGHQLIFRISDNGKGFETGAKSSGNGLINMQARALEINALLKITSSPDAGSTFEFSAQAIK